MENKKLIYLIGILALVVFAATFSLFMLIPDEKYSIIQPVKYGSMEEYKKYKMQESFNDVIDNSQRALLITIDEDELNELLAIEYKEIKEKGTNIPEIMGFRGEIASGKIKILIDSHILGIIPTQYKFELIPGIENNKMIFFLSRAEAGRFPLPKKLILNKIKKSQNQDFTIDVDRANMVLSNKLPKQFAFQSVEVRDNKIELQVGVFIQSLDDLMEVLGAILPGELGDIIDKIPIEGLLREGAGLLKDMTLQQIDRLMKSIKSGIISDSIKNITSPENIEKAKNKLRGTTLDSIKSAADKAEQSLNKNSGSNSAGNGGLKDRIVDAVKDKFSSENIDNKVEILKGVLDSVRQE